MFCSPGLLVFAAPLRIYAAAAPFFAKPAGQQHLQQKNRAALRFCGRKSKEGVVSVRHCRAVLCQHPGPLAGPG